jgi:hypothetical protein
MKECGMNAMPSTVYPELQWVLNGFVVGIQTALLDNLVGAYLVGSLATGDFDLDSDVDFIVLTNDELTNNELQSLQRMHEHIHALGCYPAEHLEGSYISKHLLNQAELVGVEPVWYVDNGSTVLEKSTHDNQWHVRWVLRERGITLTGPSPRGLLSPIPAGSLRAEMITAMHKLAGHFLAEIDGPLRYFNSRFGQSFAVLTCCRILQTLETGVVSSKHAGVNWAKRSLDAAWHGLIQDAWVERDGVRFCVKIREQADQTLLRKTAEFMDYGTAECGRLYDNYRSATDL